MPANANIRNLPKAHSKSACAQATPLNTLKNDPPLLHKALHIQSCLIYGHTLAAIMQSEQTFLTETSGCGLMAVLIKQQSQLVPALLIDGRRQLLKELKRHKVALRHVDFKQFARSHAPGLDKPHNLLKLDSLHPLLNGVLNQKQCRQLEQHLDFAAAYVRPIFCYQGKKIGYSVFIAQHAPLENTQGLERVHALLQTVIAPLYDSESATFFSRCTRICSQMPLLTDTEKRTLKLLLAAKSNAEIAQTLNVSPNTVKTHLKHIFGKYHVHSKVELFQKMNSHRP
jgi:DNA-binding CsgD family transcriptional regulator